MKSLGLGRYALAIGAAAAMLVGCGSETGVHLGPSLAARAAERTRPDITYGVLYKFKGAPKDGSAPNAGLIDVNDTLYGTTLTGGLNGDGTVFSITPSGKETALYSFKGYPSDGDFPRAGLVNVGGTLYGTTSYGGTNDDGTVFSITKSGAETVLYSFGALGDGINPFAGLVSVDGTLYGTTAMGGAYLNCDYETCGTVYKVTTSGKESVLYSFTGSKDGGTPVAGLINVSGGLYGTTVGGGADNGGTVFSITTSGKENVFYSFGQASRDAGNPRAGLIDVNGALYGTTAGGGKHAEGAVFAISKSGKERVLHSFGGGLEDGIYPYAGLIKVETKFYGTTTMGGPKDVGTVFAITKSGTESVLHSFGGSGDGGYPYAGLTQVSGTIYGTTAEGGTKNNGTVFSLRP